MPLVWQIDGAWARSVYFSANISNGKGKKKEEEEKKNQPGYQYIYTKWNFICNRLADAFDIPLKSLITFYHIQPTRQTVAAAELQAWEDNKRS